MRSKLALLHRIGTNRPKAKRLLGVFACLVAAICLLWVFRGVDLHNFLHQFEILRPEYLALSILFNTAVYFSNALRWSILLRPLARVRYWKAAQAIYIGLNLNEVLPLLPGEIIRCYLLTRWSKLPLKSFFASAALERVFDGL